MAVATIPLILQILQILSTAEPSIITAIHNLLTGTGTTDDLAVLAADKIAWQAVADKAAAEIAKATPAPAVQKDPRKP
jgi:hypothetical protein